MRYWMLVLAIAALGCDRAPAPPSSSAAPSVEGTPAMGELPPGHPPTDSTLPPGHPPTDSTLPPGHPPTGGAGMPAGPSGADAFDPAHPAVGGIRWETRAPLTYRAPQSSMRAAEYAVGTDGAAVMSVFHFPGMGGSVQSNVDRWVSQLSQPDGRPSSEVATITHLEPHGLAVTVVDVSGDFAGGMGAPPATGQRLLGAIVEGPEGPVFFKLLGPAAAVASARSAFDAMVASFAPQG